MSTPSAWSSLTARSASEWVVYTATTESFSCILLRSLGLGLSPPHYDGRLEGKLANIAHSGTWTDVDDQVTWRPTARCLCSPRVDTQRCWSYPRTGSRNSCLRSS